MTKLMRGRPRLARSRHEGYQYYAPVNVVRRYGRRVVEKIIDALIDLERKKIGEMKVTATMDAEIYEKRVGDGVFEEAIYYMYSLPVIIHEFYFDSMEDLEKVCEYVYENIVKKKAKKQLKETTSKGR